MKVAYRTSDSKADISLHRQMSKGSEKAYHELFERHWEHLYAISVSILKNREIAKDVVQEIFLSLWENRQKRDIENVGGYLSRATKFASLKEIRDEMPTRQEPLDEVSAYTSSNVEQMDAAELQVQIEKAINELPERCAEVFLHSREEQLTNKEIAEKLGLSQRTVETHISNAIKLIRKKLPKELLILAPIALLL